MLRLKKPEDFIFESGSLIVPENNVGQIFVGVNTLDSSRRPQDFVLYRWDRDTGWALLCRHDGQAADSSRTTRLAFDDSPRKQLVFLIHEVSVSFLYTINHDGQTLFKTPCPTGKYAISYISRFPNGDYLLYGEDYASHCHFAQRLATEGMLLWTHRWTNGELGRAIALADNTTALLVCSSNLSVCRLKLLDADGQPLQTLEESLCCDTLCLPEIYPSAGGWVIEDASSKPADPLVLVHRFRRLHFNDNWRLLYIKETSANARTRLLEHTFYPDGVLLGALSPFPPVRFCWAPLDGSPAHIVFSGEELAEQPALAVPGIPLFRMEDGSLLFALSGNNDNARFSVLGVSPNGEALWAKKFRCDGKRYILLRGNRMVVILSSFAKSSAAVYELPQPAASGAE